jgi:hypothetical protein
VDHQKFPIVFIQGTVLTAVRRPQGDYAAVFVAELNFIFEVLNFVYGDAFQVLLHREIAFLNIPEELLSVRASLGARPRGNVFLDHLPILAVQLEGF